PLLRDHSLANVEPPRVEVEIGPALEDRADVVPHLVAVGGLAGGVVLEDHVGRVHGHDRVEVMVVPRLVVAADCLLETLGRVLSHAGEDMFVTSYRQGEREEKPWPTATRSSGSTSSRRWTGAEEPPGALPGRRLGLRPSASTSSTSRPVARSLPTIIPATTRRRCSSSSRATV